jgi:hypothetical protein
LVNGSATYSARKEVLTIHELERYIAQGLLAGPGLSLQAQPSGRTADNEDFGSDPPSIWWPGER